MNRLEREVLEELEADYEFNEDRAVAIVALVREAVEQEIADKVVDVVKKPIDVIAEVDALLGINKTGITNSATGVTATKTNPYGTITIGATPALNYPRISSRFDGLRQHMEVECSCGWGFIISTSLNDYTNILLKDINDHGRIAHGMVYDLVP